jgi:hypothetical protein
MATTRNSRPKGPGSAPVIALYDGGPSDLGRLILRLVPAIFISVIVHAFLLGTFALFSPSSQAKGTETTTLTDDQIVQTEQAEETKKDPFATTDVDPAAQEFDTDINYSADRKADVSVPGTVDLNEAIGIKDGDKNTAPFSIPAPGGFGGKGQGGALELANLPGTTTSGIGEIGGYGKGMPLAGSFYGRSGATKEFALREGGGTGASEAAVAKGLEWISRQQSPDGHWALNGAFKDKGTDNDIAGTAFGLLPLLAAGKTHKPAKDNKHDKVILKGLNFLKSKQDAKKGDFGGTMYGHGLATIAICEAYGLTQDPNLRPYAQRAVNFIVYAQHERGGWRYAPHQEGDMSVTGWQVMALKSAQMAGLDVPELTMKKAIRYVDEMMNQQDKGYGYVGPNSTPTMTAVGLLCRQYLQNWGPQKLEMIEGVKNHLRPRQPKSGETLPKDIYFYYYATQVMHHYGGEAWKEWNKVMRDGLIASQENNKESPNYGSWSSLGDPHSNSGGRLMITSMNLLTLEVYYRYLPLYYREAGAKKDANILNK